MRACIKDVHTWNDFAFKYMIAPISLLHVWRHVFDIFEEGAICINQICDITFCTYLNSSLRRNIHRLKTITYYT